MQTVMVIEDDQIIREELTALLKNEGYLVQITTEFETIPDYVTKPYNIPVLLARIKAVLRRNGGEAAEPDI